MKNLPVNESLSGEILVSGVSSSYVVRGKLRPEQVRETPRGGC